MQTHAYVLTNAHQQKILLLNIKSTTLITIETSGPVIDLTDTSSNSVIDLTIDSPINYAIESSTESSTESLNESPNESPINSQPDSSTDSSEVSRKINYQIYGYERPCFYKKWNLPFVSETKDRFFHLFHKIQPNYYMQLRNGDRDGIIHMSKTQKYNIKLKNININDKVIVIAKLVGNSKKHHKLLSLLATCINTNQSQSNLSIVSLVNNDGEYMCEFYLINHHRKKSKDRFSLHIAIKINDIEIELAKYYIILHHVNFKTGSEISEFITTSDTCLKSGHIEYTHT